MVAPVLLYDIFGLPIYTVKCYLIPLVDKMIGLSTPGGVSWTDLPGQPVHVFILIRYVILSAVLIWQFIELRKFSWRFFLTMAAFIIVDCFCNSFIGWHNDVTELFSRIAVRATASCAVALYFVSLRRFFDPPRRWAERRRRREEGESG